MRVDIGQVRLYVKDGAAVQQVRAADAQDRPLLGLQVHPEQAHAGQADGVRPEGRARGEDAHALVPPRRGGRTVADQPSRTAWENPHTSQMWL